jgi:hypothetical protein
MLHMTKDQLMRLLEEAAKRGIESAPTAVSLTAKGIAATVYIEWTDGEYEGTEPHNAQTGD